MGDIRSRNHIRSEGFELPKVSILIPTYNRPHFFELALKSALAQTYPNIEIIICDDSTNDETADRVKPYLSQYPNIRYRKNETTLGQFANDLQLFDLATGDYINYLMDDDLFHPEKIEKMMAYFLQDEKEEITLVTSHRQIIDEQGEIRPDWPVTMKLFDQDTILDGKQFGNFVLRFNFNCIGEPTTVLFRKKDLFEPFGVFCGRDYGCNVDMATWLNLLSKGKIVYIAETLSYFRIHSGQQLHSLEKIIQGITDYAHEILNAPTRGFFQDSKHYQKAVNHCTHIVKEVLDKCSGKSEINLHELRDLYQSILQLQEELIGPRLQIREPALVSIVIPAYNRPHYLELALKSALAQTYQPIEIIICDDSTNNEVQAMVQAYQKQERQIHYVKNQTNLFTKNFQKCFDLANGDYVNFLMDDDLFHPEKIEKMVKSFRDPNVTLVTSHRQPIDEAGKPLPLTLETSKILETTTTMDGILLGNYVLKNGINVIGEPTTVLFRKKDLTEPFGTYRQKPYVCINDLATWMLLLSKGKAVYMAETLSYFRKHKGQNQSSLSMTVPSVEQWIQLIRDSRHDGFLINERDYKYALNQQIKQAAQFIHQILDAKQEELFVHLTDALQTCIEQIMHYHDPYVCVSCNDRFFNFHPLLPNGKLCPTCLSRLAV
jgi:glycosyltransferase involved in cell wall biosynthesis